MITVKGNPVKICFNHQSDHGVLLHPDQHEVLAGSDLKRVTHCRNGGSGSNVRNPGRGSVEEITFLLLQCQPFSLVDIKPLISTNKKVTSGLSSWAAEKRFVVFAALTLNSQSLDSAQYCILLFTTKTLRGSEFKFENNISCVAVLDFNNGF